MLVSSFKNGLLELNQEFSIIRGIGFHLFTKVIRFTRIIRVCPWLSQKEMRDKQLTARIMVKTLDSRVG